MNPRILYFFLIGFILVIGCNPAADDGTKSLAVIKDIPVPCQEGGEANLFIDENGKAYLSWVEYLNDSIDALRFSTLDKHHWTSPGTIVTGSDWFVNWADFPSIVAYPDGGRSFAAHWLQKSADGTYDYDVRVSQSVDSGQNWATSFVPHRDSVAAEHGFVSMLPISSDQIFATWLDGRNTKGEESHGSDGHDHQGAMTLRAATFDRSGQLSNEVELDSKVCDCCQTSAARTENGIIVAYRGRSDKEVRDIEVVRQVDGKWTKPELVFADNWEIAGCPVNGPEIETNGSAVVVAWFTAAGSNPKVKVSFSDDNGETFELPIRIDNGHPLGRVDVELLTKDEAIVSWLEKKEDDAAIMTVRINRNGIKGVPLEIAETSPTRQSGFPVMEKVGGDLLFAWTHVDSTTSIKTALVSLNEI